MLIESPGFFIIPRNICKFVDMFKKRLKNPILLFYALLVYIVLQFGWWLYLIFSLYREIYTDPSMMEKKTWMLLGEGFVFLIILLLGVIVIRRTIKRQQELNQLHENFLMSVSHELKTPISSVKLFLQTLKKRELDPDKRNEIYSRSLGEVNRLDSLVGNILLARSISNNNYFLNKSKILLDEFINSKIDQIKSTVLSSHDIELNLQKTEIEIDVIAFESILLNLLGNAVKYSPKESKITVNLRTEIKDVILEVMDEGPGIENNQRDKVFSKFYRVENEITRKSKGTGLGLFIAKSLIEQHGGTITLGDNKPTGLVVEIIFKA